MSLVLVTAPTVEPITVAQVKAQLNIEGTAFDSLIPTYIAAVREHLDGRDGILGRALVRQTWDLKLDEFDADDDEDGGIEIPLPPLQSITSVKYLDLSGIEQTLAASHYRVVGVGTGWHGRIVPAYGEFWPDTYCVPEAVTIRFVAGYDPTAGDTPDYTANVPGSIKLAMLMLAGDLFKYRETISTDNIKEVPSYVAASNLLASYTDYKV